jgi:uncharacterized protein (DUF433 family)
MSNQHRTPDENRITFNPAQCGGRPCIRGMRIRVSDILTMLAEGVSAETILADFPDLEPEDISAALRFAAKRIDIPRLAA